MATNVVELVNQALTSLNIEPINSIDEDRKSARFANQKYEHTRDAVLRMHPWNSATRRVSLTLLTDVPSFEFSFTYQLPSDFLYLKSLNQSDLVRHRIEYPRHLITDESGVEIEYIARIESVVEMDALLQEAIAAKLAFELSIPLAGSIQLRDRMDGEFKDKLREARRADSSEGPTDGLEGSDWLDARIIGVTGGDPTKVLS